MTIEAQRARLQIRAITLRGIGSYLEGARLELRPLTILCGANGSGKSTWFRVLQLLRRSLDLGLLPFGLADEFAEASSRNATVEYGYTNALVSDGRSGASPDSSAADAEFGPPGTVGLELRFAEDCWIEKGPLSAIVLWTLAISQPEVIEQ